MRKRACQSSCSIFFLYSFIQLSFFPLERQYAMDTCQNNLFHKSAFLKRCCLSYDVIPEGNVFFSFIKWGCFRGGHIYVFVYLNIHCWCSFDAVMVLFCKKTFFINLSITQSYYSQWKCMQMWVLKKCTIYKSFMFHRVNRYVSMMWIIVLYQ